MFSNKLILASSSPRRKEILESMNIDFDIIPAQGEEIASGTPENVVKSLAMQKCKEIANTHKDQYVLAADTIVYIDGIVLGKPKNKEDAYNMMKKLSANMHEVYTGVCLYNPTTQKYDVRYEKSKVYFDELDNNEIEEYINSKEPYDKAGGYALQGYAGAFICKVEGSVSNIIGLPMHIVRKILKENNFN